MAGCAVLWGGGTERARGGRSSQSANQTSGQRRGRELKSGGRQRWLRVALDTAAAAAAAPERLAGNVSSSAHAAAAECSDRQWHCVRAWQGRSRTQPRHSKPTRTHTRHRPATPCDALQRSHT